MKRFLNRVIAAWYVLRGHSVMIGMELHLTPGSLVKMPRTAIALENTVLIGGPVYDSATGTAAIVGR
jgi:hypothetical protein